MLLLHVKRIFFSALSCLIFANRDGPDTRYISKGFRLGKVDWWLFMSWAQKGFVAFCWGENKVRQRERLSTIQAFELGMVPPIGCQKVRCLGQSLSHWGYWCESKESGLSNRALCEMWVMKQTSRYLLKRKQNFSFYGIVSKGQCGSRKCACGRHDWVSLLPICFFFSHGNSTQIYTWTSDSAE